jgi:hypothetical protein
MPRRQRSPAACWCPATVATNSGGPTDRGLSATRSMPNGSWVVRLRLLECSSDLTAVSKWRDRRAVRIRFERDSVGLAKFARISARRSDRRPKRGRSCVAERYRQLGPSLATALTAFSTSIQETRPHSHSTRSTRPTSSSALGRTSRK